MHDCFSVHNQPEYDRNYIHVQAGQFLDPDMKQNISVRTFIHSLMQWKIYRSFSTLQ